MFELYKIPNNIAIKSSIVWIFCIGNEHESIASEIHSAFLRESPCISYADFYDGKSSLAEYVDSSKKISIFLSASTSKATLSPTITAKVGKQQSSESCIKSTDLVIVRF